MMIPGGSLPRSASRLRPVQLRTIQKQVALGTTATHTQRVWSRSFQPVSSTASVGLTLTRRRISRKVSRVAAVVSSPMAWMVPTEGAGTSSRSEMSSATKPLLRRKRAVSAAEVASSRGPKWRRRSSAGIWSAGVLMTVWTAKREHLMFSYMRPDLRGF